MHGRAVMRYKACVFRTNEKNERRNCNIQTPLFILKIIHPLNR